MHPNVKGATLFPITIIVEEIKDDYVSESRGYSTVIMIS